MNSDVELIQRARGMGWVGVAEDGVCIGRRWLDERPAGGFLRDFHAVAESCGDAHEPPWPISPDPLADTPEGWWEFGQILRWAHESGWLWFKGDAWMIRGPGNRYGEAYHVDERVARIAALAAAIRHESEAKQ